MREGEPLREEARDIEYDSVAFLWNSSTFRNVRYHLDNWVYNPDASLNWVNAYNLPSSVCLDYKWSPLRFRGKADWVFGREW